MSAELEQQLRRAFDRLPRPTREATVRARAAALATMPPERRRLGGSIIVALAAVAAAVTAGAAALAATGNLHVDLGARPRAAPATVTRLALPPETHGIAIVAGGRLWLATRGGLRIEGMAVSTAELSPRALYAAVGVGSSLVALAPGRRRAWTQATRGSVLAASWSPDGLKIAYVVRTRHTLQLRLIEGDGDHDRLLDRGVSALKPSWRPDSLALTYSLANRRVAAFDLGRNRRTLGRRVLPAAVSARPLGVRSPRGDLLAVAVRRPHRMLEVRIVSRGNRTASGRLLLRVRAPASPVAISWR